MLEWALLFKCALEVLTMQKLDSATATLSICNHVAFAIVMALPLLLQA